MEPDGEGKKGLESGRERQGAMSPGFFLSRPSFHPGNLGQLSCPESCPGLPLETGGKSEIGTWKGEEKEGHRSSTINPLKKR